MFELYAIAGGGVEQRRFSPQRTPANHPKHRECSHRNLYMRIEGDEPVSDFIFENSEVTVICRTDLLISPKPVNTAAYIAKRYQEHGDAFVPALRGSFAIILYDHQTDTLKAWTDQFGVERLAYTETDHSLAVATDLNLLSNNKGQRILNTAAIHEYLLYTCVPTPNTIYKEIFKLAPGHQLISRPTVAAQPYWDLVYEESRAHVSEKALAARIRDGVRSAVEVSLRNLDGQVPGCFLSGGTDSSSVAGFVGQLSRRPPKTFSIGFDDPRYNEITYARIAAKRFSADHHEYFVKPDDILFVLQKTAPVYAEPFGNSSIVPTFYCARLAAEHGVTHLLAGDGGDELFGGNARYAHDRTFQLYGNIPSWIRKGVLEPVLPHVSNRTNLRLFNLAASYVRRSNVPVPDRYFSYSLLSGVPEKELFTDDFLSTVDGNPLSAARNHFSSARAHSDLDRWLYLDLKITIADNDLRKVTATSRLAGVTPRYPFLNPELAELSGTIPPALKVRGKTLRYLFKKAMQDLLPEEIIKKSKHGFGLPYSVWLGDSKPLREFTFDVLGSPRCRQRGYFRPSLLEWLWSQYQSVHRGYYGEILWVLLMLELWHVHHADASAARERTNYAVTQLN